MFGSPENVGWQIAFDVLKEKRAMDVMVVTDDMMRFRLSWLAFNHIPVGVAWNDEEYSIFCLSVCLSVFVFSCLSVCLSVFSVFLSSCLSVC